MENKGSDKIVFLIVITGRKQKDALLCELLMHGAQLVNTVYARGTVKAGYLQNILGLIPEEHKVMITCILPDSKSDEVLNVLVEKFNFHKPNTGIAFTIPIDRLSF